MKKKLVMFVVAASMLAVSMTGCAELDGSETVAEFGDTKITADMANFYARYQQAQYETYYASILGDDMWTNEVEEGKTYEETVKDDILTSLEIMYVLDAHKEEYDISLTKEETDAIEQAAEEFDAANAADDKEAISGDVETVKEFLELVTVQEKMYEAMTADVDTEVSDEEAAQKSMQYVYFSFTQTDDDGNSVELTDEEKEELKKTAEEFRSGAVDAEDFEAYATEAGYTATTLTFDSETTSPSQTLIEAADALGEGEVAEVVEDTAGYYVVKLTSLLDRDATDAEKEAIVNERKQEQYDSLCEEWQEEADIKVNESIWNKIDFVNQGVTIKETTTETEE